MHVTTTETTAQAGVIYGAATATEFECAVTDPGLRRLDYVATTTTDGIEVLAQVMGLRRESSLSFDEALTMSDDEGYEPDEKVSAKIQVIGFRDDRGLLQVPRSPFRAGTQVSWAPEALIQRVLGLVGSSSHGAYLGILKGTNLPVNLHINTLVQKHVSVLAKTGAGKSYCTGVLLEELLKQDVAVVIVDAHDEYHSLVHPNIEEEEVDRLLRFGLKPKAFQDKVGLWTTELNHRLGTDLLKLEGTAMGAGDIVELLGGKITGAQQGILYQAIKDARSKDPLYSLRDIIDQCHGNKSNSKWNVISALESLDSTGLFADDGIDPATLVQPGKAAIISLKGVPPDIQEVIVARLATQLFDARKSTEVPPFLFVVEEAHNYCPERGIGNAVSLGVLRTIASEGRKFGMGLCVVSQRPAKVDKNVLSQCNTQIILKVTNPNDLKAIVGSVEGLTGQAADEIARLPVGVAMVAGGNLGMPIMVEVRTRQSRHGGASVDVVSAKAKGTGGSARPMPRMKKGITYDLDDDQDASSASHRATKPNATSSTSSGKTGAGRTVGAKSGDSRRKAEEPFEERSDRRIQWGRSTPGQEGTTDSSKGTPAVTDESARSDMPPSKEAAETSTTAPLAPSLIRERSKAPADRDAHGNESVRVPSQAAGRVPAMAPGRRASSARDEAEARAAMEPRDVRIHRVANRVGYVATLRSEETLSLLRKAAARAGVAPDNYLEPFAKVGRTHCFKDEPDCAPCPLRAKCSFKAKRDARASGSDGTTAGSASQKGVLGRFFGRR